MGIYNYMALLLAEQILCGRSLYQISRLAFLFRETWFLDWLHTLTTLHPSPNTFHTPSHITHRSTTPRRSVHTTGEEQTRPSEASRRTGMMRVMTIGSDPGRDGWSATRSTPSLGKAHLDRWAHCLSSFSLLPLLFLPPPSLFLPPPSPLSSSSLSSFSQWVFSLLSH